MISHAINPVLSARHTAYPAVGGQGGEPAGSGAARQR